MRGKAKQAAKSAALYALAAVRWLPAAVLIGLLGGAVGAAFHHGIALAAGLREAHGWVIYMLPVGAVVIALLYRAMRLGPDAGTNLVLEAVRSEKQVPLLLAPAMFVATVLTQFVGGSAGREGAALQIGGSLAQGVAKLLRVKEENCHLLVLCGMAAVFSALFGTPVAAAVFVLEVASVGRFLYSALVPTLCASLTAGAVARTLHGEVVRMALTVPGEAGVVFTLRTAVLAVACALLSIVFCLVVHQTGHLAGKLLKNEYVRALVLGAALLGLTALSGTRDYNGAGMAFVERCVAGERVDWYAFALKLVFTAVTLAAGYKGGEIVPTFFVGAAFGATVGPLLGLGAGYGAAVGMIGMFCGVVNCPFAALLLAVEIFGGAHLVPFAVTTALCYVFSGYFGLYSSQHILRSKVGTELIDRAAR